MDIGQWLNGIGLGQYEALFREHAIDTDVPPDLTERENSRNSVRRPRCASLTRRNYGGFCLPGACQ